MERVEQYKSAVESYLNGFFTENVGQKKVLEAMRYSLNAGGKRLRPIFVLEFCRACGGDWQKALPAAAAIEMVHTYSLIHDDLPCMDDDTYRRGRLTNHKVFGEATAVLAGDGLLTYAFQVLAASEIPNRAKCIEVLASCAGPYGMVGGQQLDLEYENAECNPEISMEIDRLKTCALIKAACVMGVLCADGTAAQLVAAEQYADKLGLAFQIRDDMLDVIGDSAKLGKNTGCDTNKSTLLRYYGLEKCEKLVASLSDEAVVALQAIDDASVLTELAYRLVNREN